MWVSDVKGKFEMIIVMYIKHRHFFAFMYLVRRSTAITEGDHLAQSLHASLPKTAHSQGTARETPYYHQPEMTLLLDFSTPSWGAADLI